MSTTVTVGFDIGGTNMRAGVVNDRGEIIHALAVPVPDSAEGLEQGIADLVASLGREHSIGAVGFAIAGFLDPKCEVVRFAPHLPWRDYPAKRKLEELLQLPVRLEHDANSAAWGEFRFGAAQGNPNWVLFALGTGIGATLMHEGEIYRGAFGTAPEFGHLTVVPGGRECACGKSGCLERYCSGSALEETAREMLVAHPDVATALRVDDCSGKRVMRLAGLGDALALMVVEDFACWLGSALSMVCDVLDPGAIVIGGGVSGAADLYLDRAKMVMAQRIVGAGFRPLPTVSCAQLGGDAGMIGVADLARKLL
ncbi:ROK family protein [Corynebacterium felinum]|uniref:Glucokinase n=1 Tax=Corynebacterium felinum TaxID=131318 RepID=A0ABU2BC43_9CORY|nr:ROK family protein [Corynebacterium felinum]MDF5821319.1 ROK family protein [Corynebacterium felinum]MDR7356163.1 glucokinase [Corynebacterium felinum]WJY95497.1 Glucokinase [Corynebacterium felinum]